MIETVIKWAIIVAIVAGLATLIMGVYEAWRAHVWNGGKQEGVGETIIKWNADTQKRTAAAAKQLNETITRERTDAAKAMEIERDAQRTAKLKQQAAEAAATRSAAAAGGLSGNIASLNAGARAAGLPEAAACPGEFGKQRDAAIRARELLGACGQEYRDMGQAAEKRESELETQLDTAMKYIGVTTNK